MPIKVKSQFIGLRVFAGYSIGNDFSLFVERQNNTFPKITY